MVQEPERAVHHVQSTRGHLRAAAEASKVVVDTAVAVLESEGQVLAREQLVFRDQTVEASQSSIGKVWPLIATRSRSRLPVASSRPPNFQVRARRATGS